MRLVNTRVCRLMLCCIMCALILTIEETHCAKASKASHEENQYRQHQEQQVEINNSSNDKKEVSSELPQLPERDEVMSLTQIMFVSCNRHDRSQDYWASMATAAQCEVAPSLVKLNNPFCVAMYHGTVAQPNSVYKEQQEINKVDDNSHNINDTRVVPVGGCGSVLDSPEAQRFRIDHVKAEIHAHQQRSDDNNNVNKEDELIRGEEEKKWKDSTMTEVEKESLLLSPTIATNEHNQQMQQAPLDGFIWLGDAIYADKKMTRHGGMPFGHVKYPLSVIEQMWKTQHAAPEYVAFRESCLTRSMLSPEKKEKESEEEKHYKWKQQHDDHDNYSHLYDNYSRSNVFGTWDDHDMGANDAGKEYPFKNITQKFLLNFIDAPAEDVRWNRPGVYTFHTIPFHEVLQPVHTNQSAHGNASSISNVIVDALRASYDNAMCLILLDVRSFRDPPNATNSGDMLGEPQWQWLESLLKYNVTNTNLISGKQPCAITYIVSGIQLILDEKISENWAAFPHSRDRLLYLLRMYHAERVTFITGDVHMGEIGLDTSSFTVQHALGYPFVEATSSGLTHSVGDFPFASLHIHRIFHTWRRVGVYPQKNFASARLDYNPRLVGEHRTTLVNALRKLQEAQKQKQEEEQKQKQNLKQHEGNSNNNKENTTSQIDTANKSKPHSDKTHETVSVLRTLVNQLVNVTFTVYAIPKAGAPVLRLTFPLFMLTYNESHSYIQSSADKETGFVHLHSLSEGMTTFTLSENNFANVPIGNSNNTDNSTSLHRILHYPNTEPVPFVTALSRFMQRHVFTTRSVTASAIATLELFVGFTALLIILSVCLCCSCNKDSNGCLCDCFGRCFKRKVQLSYQETSAHNSSTKHEHITYKDIKRKIAEHKREKEVERGNSNRNKYNASDVIITPIGEPNGNSKLNLRANTSNAQSKSQNIDINNNSNNNNNKSGSRNSLNNDSNNKVTVSSATQTVATQPPIEAKKDV